MHAAYAAVADRNARTIDQRFFLFFALSAERAELLLIRTGAMPAPAAAPSGPLHNLMHALMAQAERLCDLTKRRARQLESAHRTVELGASDVSRLFGVNDAGLGCLRLLQKVGI